MTMRRSVIVLVVVVLVSVAIVAMGAKRVGAARAQVESAQGVLDQVVRDAREVVELRGKQQRVELRERPPQDVIAQVNAVLAEVGIPSRAMRSLTPEADANIAHQGSTSTKLKRQSVRLVLENLSVQEIGAFLLKWRSSQSIWTTTRIELSHVQSGRSNSESRGDASGGYDATLIISALYVDALPLISARGGSGS